MSVDEQLSHGVIGKGGVMFDIVAVLMSEPKLKERNIVRLAALLLVRQTFRLLQRHCAAHLVSATFI